LGSGATFYHTPPTLPHDCPVKTGVSVRRHSDVRANFFCGIGVIIFNQGQEVDERTAVALALNMSSAQQDLW